MYEVDDSELLVPLSELKALSFLLVCLPHEGKKFLKK